MVCICQNLFFMHGVLLNGRAKDGLNLISLLYHRRLVCYNFNSIVYIKTSDEFCSCPLSPPQRSAINQGGLIKTSGCSFYIVFFKYFIYLYMFIYYYYYFVSLFFSGLFHCVENYQTGEWRHVIFTNPCNIRTCVITHAGYGGKT